MDASDYTQYRPLMFSIAYRMTGSVADAEDIVQEAFLRLAGGAEAESPRSRTADGRGGVTPPEPAAS